jgi:zinc/manganese transport system permease protein
MSQLLEMLGLPFLACLLMSGILAYSGMHVLKREIIFIDITLAQVAAVGTIIAHLAFHTHEDSVLSYGISLGCVLVLAAFCAALRKNVVRIPIEAVIGVSYAIAAATAIFLIGLAPTEIHAEAMLAGSLLWIEKPDVVFAACILAVTGLAFYLLHKPLLRISEGHRNTPDSDEHPARWDFLFYALVGIVITTTVRIAGVLVVFGFLILPATTSALFSSRWGIRLLIAWTVAAVASATGLLGAYYLDFSVGPVIALCMGIFLVVAAGITRLRRMPSPRLDPIEAMSVAHRPE